MCNNCSCARLSLEDQASIWADIKTARKALEAHRAFLVEMGTPEPWLQSDKKFAKLAAIEADLWSRFRVL